MKKMIAIVAVCFLSACASANLSTPQQDETAKQFKAAASDKSNLYIFRDERIGAVVSMTVSLDERILGKTAAHTYFFLTLEPGPHSITSEAENTSTLKVDMEAGQEYYVWQEVKMGLLYARNKLQLVTSERGQEGVLKSKRIANPSTLPK